MELCEFSETQFVIGYVRELFNNYNTLYPFFRWNMPSTRAEARWASDLIIRDFSRGYRYSEFYQFKRSHLFNNETFTDASGNIIDTSVTNYHGFKIYNSANTHQFNTLQRFGRNPNFRVYYGAPIFHTIRDFRTHFRSNLISANTKLIDFSSPSVQGVNIPLGTTHTVLFDHATSYICSDITKIDSILGSERNKFSEGKSKKGNLKDTMSFIKEHVLKEEDSTVFENRRDLNNFFELRETLASECGLCWFPYFDDEIIF